MSDFINNISQFIQEQFPAHYRDQIDVDPTASQRAVLIDFVEAYYEWIESVQGESFIRNRQMFEYRDIDETLNEFIKYFQNTFLRDLAYDTATDDRFVIKHILDLYRSKGSPASIKLMLNLLFNVDANVYFPGQDILRASDSKWINPIYVEVVSSERSVDLVGKGVFGSVSGATAFVEAVVTKRSNNRLIDILYLSNVEGTFVFGDIITDDGILANGPSVIGSLSNIIIDPSTVGGNSIGDIFDVIGTSGKNAKVRVTGLLNRSGAVDFSILDGGFGYTTDDNTKIYISDLVVLKDNTVEVYQTNDIITQTLNKIYLSPLIDFIEEVSVGDEISGFNDSGTEVANGIILDIGTELISNIITPFVIIQPESGTFLENQKITLTSNVEFIINETIVEGSDITIIVDSANGTFSNGEIVFQRDASNTDINISTRYAEGEVVSYSNNVLILTNAFGDFQANSELTGKNSGAFANAANVSIDFAGSSGIINSKVSEDQYIVKFTSESYFGGNNNVRGESSKVIRSVANTEVLTPTNAFSGLVNTSIQDYESVDYSGIVIGQNTTSIGIGTTNDTDFFYLEGVSKISNQDGTILTINSAATGVGASFEIGSIKNQETITTTIEKITDENISNVKYESILINGQNSGVGRVDSISIIDGGTGYDNSSIVTFTGGGFNDEQPLIVAGASVTTDANGTIVSVTVTAKGEGYFIEPTISVADGSGANLELNMLYGYGFSADPFGDANTIIGDVLTDTTLTIGEIATLANVFRGQDYTGRPYVKVINPTIANSTKKDQIANITIISGSFSVGEVITQANTGAKGIVKSANVNSLSIRNASFEEDFILSSIGGDITGSTTGAIATINSIIYDDSADFMGENANISNFVVESDGTIDTVEILSSGIGYIDGEDVTLRNEDKEVTGTAVVQRQGIDIGYWKSRNSHLNSEKRLHDNNYYQEYSYDVQSGINLNEYRDIILDIVHLSGTKLFGTVIKTTEKAEVPNLETTITQS